MSTASQPASSTPVTYRPSNGANNAGPSSVTPPAALKTYTDSKGFTYPAIWSFPPFFTLQPNPSTQAHQLELWVALVLSWGQHHRIFSVNVDSPDPGEVFRNKQINRKLLPPALKTLLTHMVTLGSAAPDPPKQASTYLLYWRKPDEWANLIYDWVGANGLTGSIMTFFEITEGDLAETTEFYELPAPLLRKAMDILVKRGKAQIIKGEGEMGEGARFL